MTKKGGTAEVSLSPLEEAKGFLIFLVIEEGKKELGGLIICLRCHGAGPFGAEKKTNPEKIVGKQK